MEGVTGRLRRGAGGQSGGLSCGRSRDAPGDRRGSPAAPSEGCRHLESQERRGGSLGAPALGLGAPAGASPTVTQWQREAGGGPSCGARDRAGWHQGREARPCKRCFRGGWSHQNTQEMPLPAAQPASAAPCGGKRGPLLPPGTGMPFPAQREGTGSLSGTARLRLTGCLQGGWARRG